MGVSKGTFFHHFGDRATYLLALHRVFHDRVLDGTIEAIGGAPPGPQRLRAAADAFLDAILRQRGVRAFLLEARAEPASTAEITARNAHIAQLCRPDFEAMGWEHPVEGARLWVGLVAEAALVEREAGRREPSLRAALARFTTG